MRNRGRRGCGFFIYLQEVNVSGSDEILSLNFQGCLQLMWYSTTACVAENMTQCFILPRHQKSSWFETINQMLFHTLSTSLAFPGELVVAAWFQVGSSSNILGGSVITFALSKGHRARGWQDSGVFCDTCSLPEERWLKLVLIHNCWVAG